MMKFFLKRNYSLCHEFFKESKNYILIAVGIFFITAIIGFIFPIFFREEISNLILEMIKMLEGKTGLEIMVMIFFNNMKASFLAMALGIGLGIFPIIAGIVNGYILGFVSREVVSSEGILVMWQLLPHGVFEIPAILLSIGIGIKIGGGFFAKDFKKITKRNLQEGFRFFCFVIFPLLLIAGIIEGLLIVLVS